MTVPTWNLKRGDTWVAPQAILVTVGGVEVDLTDAAYTVAAQLRTAADSSVVAATFDVDETLLEDSKVLLSLDAETTAGLSRGTHYVDVEITSTDPAVGRRSSETWTILVDPDVTRVPAEEVGP